MTVVDGQWTPVTFDGHRRATPAAATGAPWFHLVAGGRPLVWLVGGSQLFEVTPSDGRTAGGG